MHPFRPHSTRHLIAATVAVVVAMLVGAPGAAAADDPVGFSVAPMIFDVDVAAGKSSTFQIRISNTDSVATRYTFSKEDYEGDKEEPAATPVMLGGKYESAISGYDWIDAPGPLTVPAGQERTVPFKVTAPAGATGGHYTALMVHGTSRNAGNVTATSRIGVLFLMNAGGAPPPDIKITEIREIGPTKTVTRIEYETSTTTPTKPKPVVNTKDPVTNKPLKRAVGECTTSVPSASGGGGVGTCLVDDADGTLVVDDDGNGVTSGAEQKFVALFPEQEGEGTSAKGELPTEWAGAWTSMLLPLVGIALFALYFLFLRRRRKDQDDGDDEFALGAPLT